jgi:hypothetical protein
MVAARAALLGSLHPTRDGQHECVRITTRVVGLPVRWLANVPNTSM